MNDGFHSVATATCCSCHFPRDQTPKQPEGRRTPFLLTRLGSLLWLAPFHPAHHEDLLHIDRLPPPHFCCPVRELCWDTSYEHKDGGTLNTSGSWQHSAGWLSLTVPPPHTTTPWGLWLEVSGIPGHPSLTTQSHFQALFFWLAASLLKWQGGGGGGGVKE